MSVAFKVLEVGQVAIGERMALCLDAVGHVHAVSSGALGCHRIDVHRAVSKSSEGIESVGNTHDGVGAEDDGEVAVAIAVPIYGDRSVGGEGAHMGRGVAPFVGKEDIVEQCIAGVSG